MNLKTFFAYHPHDNNEIRLEKLAIFIVAGSCCLAGIIWSAMYYVIFGLGLIAFLPFAFVLIVGSSLFLSHFTKNHHFAVYAQIMCIIYITTFIQWSIGGVFESGFVLAWAFCGPITALMFFSLRQSVMWFFLYLINIAITVIFNDFFSRHGQPVTENIRIFFFIMNLSVSSTVVFIFASYFITNAIIEREKANKLLLNILPRKIAQTLKEQDGIIADHYDEVCVLFADIVGFTNYSGQVSPKELVTNLNEIFLGFDELTEKYGLEKIKTIGDAYMVVGGLPQAQPAHHSTQAIALMALEMLAIIQQVKKINGETFSLRMGIHVGPIVAGVIGKSKFAYDLWGDTVNVASRMESSGKPGFIQVSNNVYQILAGQFHFDKRGAIEVKGKGLMETYYLLGKTQT